MTDVNDPKAGDVFTIDYPMDLQEVELYSQDEEGGGPYKAEKWCPCRTNSAHWVTFTNGPYSEVDGVLCDGVGKQVFEIIDIHKPGRYPKRVFYIQQFVTPDGHTFGKQKLRIITLEAFKRRLRGFMYQFRVDAPKGAT